jgi:hypothetical protein
MGLPPPGERALKGGLLTKLIQKRQGKQAVSSKADVLMIGSEDPFTQEEHETKKEEDSPSPPKVIKLNGKDPAKEKKVISFNVINDNQLIGD